MEKQQNRNFGNQLAISWQHCEFRKLLAISSQPLRISQTVRKQFAISVRIAKFASHMHCAFAKFASHIKLQNLSEISHCQLRNAIANFAIPLPTSQHHCQLRNTIANFAIALPTSQHIAKFANLRDFSCCEICRPCHPL